MSIYIAIIGIDGSGKSTCFNETLKVFSKEKFVAGIGDEVLLSDENKTLYEKDDIHWTATKKFLGDISKRYKNKTFYQITKFAELLCKVKIQQIIIDRYKPKFILTDGSPLINVLGWGGSFYYPQYFESAQCIKCINYLCQKKKIPLSEIGFYIRHIPGIFLVNRFRLAKFSIPDIIVFLNIKPENAIARILKRGKELQSHETKSFLDNLQKTYRIICNIISAEFGSKVIKIKADELSVEDTVAMIIKHTRSM